MRRFGFAVLLLAACCFLALPARAQDATLNVRISGEVTGTVTGAVTKIDVKNDFFKLGYVGAAFVIEITDGTIAIQVVDPHTGNPVRTLFVFDTVTRVATSATTERVFALGTEMVEDGIPHPKFGDVTFTDAVLCGTIQLDAGGAPAGVNATLEASGDADEDIVLFDGKLKARTVFVPN